MVRDNLAELLSTSIRPEAYLAYFNDMVCHCRLCYVAGMEAILTDGEDLLILSVNYARLHCTAWPTYSNSVGLPVVTFGVAYAYSLAHRGIWRRRVHG